MKSSIFSLALVAGLAAAQAKLPTCASKCISEYTTGGKIAGCGQVDIACICKNQDFLDGISCCLQESCDTAGQEAAIKYAAQICSTAGVTVPDKLSCSSSSSSKSGSSSATKSASDSTGTPSSTGTGKAASGTADSGSSTGTATGSSASSTSSGSAAAGTYSAGGLLGAIAAVLFAL